jgi:ELWxxDGT repeat protein
VTSRALLPIAFRPEKRAIVSQSCGTPHAGIRGDPPGGAPVTRRANSTRRQKVRTFTRLIGEALEARLPLAITAELLANINPTADSSSRFPTFPTPSNATINGANFFVANDGLHGYELWKTDGTTAGTVLVRDLVPGPESSRLHNLTNVSGKLFFLTHDSSDRSFLWKSDGTTAGTVTIRQFNTDFERNLTNVNGTLYFRANDGVNGYELWKSDGTVGGTVMVKDVVEGNNRFAYSEYPAELTNVNGTLYYRQSDGFGGAELWRSDGTAEGTFMVKDIRPGEGSSFAGGFTNVNGTIFFRANDGVHGPELWKSDGTAAGTVLVKDILSFDITGNIYELTNVNGTLYFAAVDDANGGELWKSEGTAAGTVLVKDILPGVFGSSPRLFTNVNGTLFFRTTGANFAEHGLWKSDGTADGTVLIKSFAPGPDENLLEMVNVNGRLFFDGYDAANGEEPWTSDGTTDGTVLVRDILPGVLSSSPHELRAFGDRLLFTAEDGVRGRELWTTITVVEPPPGPPEFDLSNRNSAAIVADVANPGQRVLLVIGGRANDVLVIEPRPSNLVQLRVKQTGRLLGIFPGDDFQRIVVFGFSGNDTIIVDPRINKPAELHGGVGNDTILGGSAGDRISGDAGNDFLFGQAGNDVLIGGAGNDQLFGGRGRDLLIGGAGRDLLSGEADDDILIGGTTAYDDDAENLDAIMAEWTSAGSFAARTSALSGLLNSGTAFSDGVRDQLGGGSGRDWFLDFALADSILDFQRTGTSRDRKN